MMLNLIWCQGWDDDGPTGECRDLGRWPAGEALLRQSLAPVEAAAGGWRPGRAVLTDDEGTPVAPAEAAAALAARD